MKLASNFKPRSVQVDMVITKADGRKIDLGTVDYWHRNPFIRTYNVLKLALAARKRLKTA